jgi:general secretion pathway protein H
MGRKIDMGLAKRSSGNNGFSLLELVMVLLVIGLAAALSYPSLMRGTAAFHLRATGRNVLNHLRYAREKAITEQKEMTVTVNRDAQTVVLSDEAGDGRKILKLPQDVKIVQIRLADQEIKDGPLMVRFLPNGSAETAEIVLKADNGGVMRLVIDPITGGSRVQPGQGESFP